VSERYVPAAGRSAFTPLYDAVNAVTMREGRWRPRLIELASAGGTTKILDLGCGTGAMAIALAQALPDARVVGVDGDPEVLKRAQAKARAAAVRIELHEAMAQRLPLPDESVECVVSTLVFHHLPARVKREALAEARRVLVPGGRLLICDLGRARDPLMRGLLLLVQLLDGFSTTRENARGKLPEVVAQAGFSDVAVVDRFRTGAGSLDLIRGLR
jgi:ubiquinone/menaquinone biosynthesis C-methylase UbiE